jgi:hypothetical protein
LAAEELTSEPTSYCEVNDECSSKKLVEHREICADFDVDYSARGTLLFEALIYSLCQAFDLYMPDVGT